MVPNSTKPFCALCNVEQPLELYSEEVNVVECTNDFLPCTYYYFGSTNQIKPSKR